MADHEKDIPADFTGNPDEAAELCGLSICGHAATRTAACTLWAFIIEPQKDLIWLANGNPCVTPYKPYNVSKYF